MSRVRIILTTTGSLEEARRIARHLVENRLAACVNILDQVLSVYRWQEAVEEAQEFLLLIKTTGEQVDAVQGVLGELHSYELPEFLVLAPEAAARPTWAGSSRASVARHRSPGVFPGRASCEGTFRNALCFIRARRSVRHLGAACLCYPAKWHG